ncbi:MAG TPA: hypothetical protein DCZ91_19300 [Lachnospiraceae bacterium]|nr:hypothetical protein [Lachnospiraceae bacterium]
MGIIRSMVNKRNKKRQYGCSRSIGFNQCLNPDKIGKNQEFNYFFMAQDTHPCYNPFRKSFFEKCKARTE